MKQWAKNETTTVSIICRFLNLTYSKSFSTHTTIYRAKKQTKISVVIRKSEGTNNENSNRLLDPASLSNFSHLVLKPPKLRKSILKPDRAAIVVLFETCSEWGEQKHRAFDQPEEQDCTLTKWTSGWRRRWRELIALNFQRRHCGLWSCAGWRVESIQNWCQWRQGCWHLKIRRKTCGAFSKYLQSLFRKIKE